MTGIQNLMAASFYGLIRGAVAGYAGLSEEKKEELHRQTATRMLDKALKGELERPYHEDEIDYIKENLGLEGASA